MGLNRLEITQLYTSAYAETVRNIPIRFFTEVTHEAVTMLSYAIIYDAPWYLQQYLMETCQESDWCRKIPVNTAQIRDYPAVAVAVVPMGITQFYLTPPFVPASYTSVGLFFLLARFCFLELADCCA